MMPFNVLIPAVEDRDLGPLLIQLRAAGVAEPVITPVGEEASRVVSSAATGGLTGLRRDLSGDLPTEWRPVRELEGQSYQWPDYKEPYPHYVVYAGTTQREGTVHFALGEAERLKTWGRDRKYIIAFLTSGTPQVPVTEFLETDDHEDTGEYLAVVRGSDGGRKMYGPGDSLPDIYAQKFRTVMYNDHIRVKGSWRKVAVLANQDDPGTMLNHALVQARRRGDL